VPGESGVPSRRNLLVSQRNARRRVQADTKSYFVSEWIPKERKKERQEERKTGGKNDRKKEQFTERIII